MAAQIVLRLEINLPGVEEVTETEEQAVLDRLLVYVPVAVEEAGIETSHPASGTGGVLQEG